MPEPSTLGVVAVASLALAVIPGPAVIYIVTRSVTQGRAAGLVSVTGIHVGTLVHVAAAVAGLSALLMRSMIAFNIVKYAGAAYLIFIGLRQFVSRDDGPIAETPRRSLATIFRQGIVVNVLNPKTGLFFVAFLPQFVRPEDGSAALQMFVLGLVFIAVAFTSDAAYALISSRLGLRLRSSETFQRRQRVFSGTVYIGLGVTAAMSGHRSS
jgi:threonine/homoserine/homoserine lactone efflux protein